jgi:uncharacterized protein
MRKALPLLLTWFVSSAAALACSTAPHRSAAPSPPRVAAAASSSPRAHETSDELQCDPAVTLSAAMRLMNAGDALDLDAIEAIRKETDAAIEYDTKLREPFIVQQVGAREAPAAVQRFKAVWTRMQYGCLLQEAKAECAAEVPEHACAVLVGMYERGIGTARSQAEATKIVQEECTRGRRSVCYRIGAFYEHAARREPLYSGRADETYTRGCERGEPLSCDRLASRHEDGIEASSRIAGWRARGESLSAELCDHGEPQACFETAERYAREGEGTPELTARVREMLRTACARGAAPACNALGECFEFGTCAPRTLETAAGFYRRACDLDNGLGCSALGMLLEAGKGLPRSPQQAVELYGRACELGNPNGCNYLCWAKTEGKVVRRNLTEAAVACRKGCDRSDSNSCTLLAWFHYVGAGVDQDRNRALELGGMACAGGDLAGCSNLGEMLTISKGAARDESRAVDLFRKACQQGSESACANLGLMHEMGIAVGADRKRAIELYRAAAPPRPKGGYRLAEDLGSFCSLRDPRACTLLGILTRHGIGVGQDPARSAFFLGKGCTLGDEWGCAAARR